MISLLTMRLSAYARTQVALAPLLTAMVILGIFYGGGRAEPAEAYGMSAVVLFPILAWQVKILLDVEPDVQRHIAITALGSRGREIANGLLAAALTASILLPPPCSTPTPTCDAPVREPASMAGCGQSTRPVRHG